MEAKANVENVSAFMVHHVLNKNRSKSDGICKKTKRLKKNRKSLLKKTVNGTNKNSVLTPRNNLSKMQKNLIQKTGVTYSTSAAQNNRATEQSPKSPKMSKTNVIPSATAAQSNKTKEQLPKSPKKSKSQAVENISTPSKYKGDFEKSFNEKRLLNWLISPIDVDEFMNNYWEKQPLHLSKRHSEFSLLLSTPIIDNLLHYSNIIFTKNIDITFYSNGEKELHNQEGVARPHVVWDLYYNKCSVRLLNPQTFVPNIHKLNSELQEYFGCFVGCNAYLTPPLSQGFAPHFDDIEAFILQIEGKKLWKVYAPRSDNEVLPRYSSCDFTEDEIGEPVMQVLLEEGDVLYLPRGYIHQACTQDSNHSLHITVSVYQCNAWIDLLEKVVPKAIENAWKNDVSFRKGLPLDYLKACGLGRNPNYKNTRSLIKKNIKQLICKLADHIQIDSAVDQLGLKLMQDALPPVLTEEEKKCTVFGGGLRMTKKGQVKGIEEFAFGGEMEVVLLRQYVSRFVKDIETGEKGSKVIYRLYYTTDNSLEYHGETTSFLIIPKSSVKAVQTLFQRYPDYIHIDQLPHESYEEKINLVADLWERGIVRTKKPILQN